MKNWRGGQKNSKTLTDGHSPNIAPTNQLLMKTYTTATEELGHKHEEAAPYVVPILVSSLNRMHICTIWCIWKIWLVHLKCNIQKTEGNAVRFAKRWSKMNRRGSEKTKITCWTIINDEILIKIFKIIFLIMININKE